MTSAIRVTEIRDRLHSADVRKVILALDYPADIQEAKAGQIIESYVVHPEWTLDGAWAGRDLVGAIGVQPGDGATAEVRHIAVLQEHRRRGIGTELIRHVFTRHGLKELHAETDRHGVGFYDKLGFTIHSLGEKYPGTERFMCTIHRDLVVG